MTSNKELTEPHDVLYRIKRGLAAYVSYLAACEMNESFSEYVLYEPILRILTARGYTVQCEVPCPGIQQPRRGDRKKLDFVATHNSVTFAMEVKWARSSRVNTEKDIEKLLAYLQHEPTSRAFICVFGTESCINKLPADKWRERGKLVIADFGRTRYGCRIYEIKNVELESVEKIVHPNAG